MYAAKKNYRLFVSANCVCVSNIASVSYIMAVQWRPCISTFDFLQCIECIHSFSGICQPWVGHDQCKDVFIIPFLKLNVYKKQGSWGWVLKFRRIALDFSRTDAHTLDYLTDVYCPIDYHDFDIKCQEKGFLTLYVEM